MVYAAKGVKDAKKIAERVPGGATVEPLTWKSAAPVVVAVGKTAAQSINQ